MIMFGIRRVIPQDTEAIRQPNIAYALNQMKPEAISLRFVG
jgi:hypothetical protein